MPLDLATLKTRLGITDTSQDAAIEAVAAQAQALCETYCDRKFDLADDSETFANPWSVILLRRWPIDLTVPPVVADDLGPLAAHWYVDAERGMLYGQYGWPYGGGPLTVDYTGGFDPWPIDLEWAVTTAFDVLWSETPGGALPPGAPGSFGNVRKYSVVGAYSVETQAGGVGEVGANAGTGWGPLPASVTSALNAYRRESRIGAG